MLVNQKYFLEGLVLLVLVLIATAPAGAALVAVNLDINAYSGPTLSGQGAYPDVGNDFWNGVDLVGNPHAGVTTGPLTAADGTTLTSITVTLSASGSWVEIGMTGNDMIDDHAQSDGITWGQAYFTVNNLTPGASYGLYVYATPRGYIGYPTRLTIGGSSQDTTGGWSGDYELGVNYVLYDDVVADGSGQIRCDYGPAPASSWGFFNGVQIIIPEPATVALLALGSVGILLRRRRA